MEKHVAFFAQIFISHINCPVTCKLWLWHTGNALTLSTSLLLCCFHGQILYKKVPFGGFHIFLILFCNLFTQWRWHSRQNQTKMSHLKMSILPTVLRRTKLRFCPKIKKISHKITAEFGEQFLEDSRIMWVIFENYCIREQILGKIWDHFFWKKLNKLRVFGSNIWNLFMGVILWKAKIFLMDKKWILVLCVMSKKKKKLNTFFYHLIYNRRASTQ